MCLLCLCNFSLHLKKLFWSYRYIGECPKIEYGRHFHGNQTRRIFFHTDYNKNTMKWLGWKISKTIFRPAHPTVVFLPETNIVLPTFISLAKIIMCPLMRAVTQSWYIFWSLELRICSTNTSGTAKVLLLSMMAPAGWPCPCKTGWCILLTWVTVLDMFTFCKMDIWRIHSRHTHTLCNNFPIVTKLDPIWRPSLISKWPPQRQFMNRPIFFSTPKM